MAHFECTFCCFITIWRSTWLSSYNEEYIRAREWEEVEREDQKRKSKKWEEESKRENAKK